MKSKAQTTYILFDQETEVRALWTELNKIVAELKIKSIKTFIKKYPLLNELKDNLKLEINEYEEDIFFKNAGR